MHHIHIFFDGANELVHPVNLQKHPGDQNRSHVVSPTDFDVNTDVSSSLLQFVHAGGITPSIFLSITGFLDDSHTPSYDALKLTKPRAVLDAFPINDFDKVFQVGCPKLA